MRGGGVLGEGEGGVRGMVGHKGGGGGRSARGWEEGEGQGWVELCGREEEWIEWGGEGSRGRL